MTVSDSVPVVVDVSVTVSVVSVLTTRLDWMKVVVLVVFSDTVVVVVVEVRAEMVRVDEVDTVVRAIDVDTDAPVNISEVLVK